MPISEQAMLSPVLALACWTLVVWTWMYATRLPAMQAHGVKPSEGLHPGGLSRLPGWARRVADNYNHLHEQPTVFYALAFYCHLAGLGDATNAALAWAYVGLRVAHSFVQILSVVVPLRFLVFVASTICLAAIAARAAIALLTG